MVDAQTRGEMPPWGCALSAAHPTPPRPPCTVGSGSEGEVTPSGHRRVQMAWAAGSRAREAPGQALGEPQGPDRGIRGRGVPHPAQGTPHPAAGPGPPVTSRGRPLPRTLGPFSRPGGRAGGRRPRGRARRSGPAHLRAPCGRSASPPPRTPPAPQLRERPGPPPSRPQPELCADPQPAALPAPPAGHPAPSALTAQSGARTRRCRPASLQWGPL